MLQNVPGIWTRLGQTLCVLGRWPKPMQQVPNRSGANKHLSGPGVTAVSWPCPPATGFCSIRRWGHPLSLELPGMAYVLVAGRFQGFQGPLSMDTSQLVGRRPRELRWYHAGAMLFGDWGTSRLYVLGLCFFYAHHASLWYMGAMSCLLLAIGWAYGLICHLYPDGGGVYTAARLRHPLLGVFGGLLLFADYTVTAAISIVDAFHYVELPQPHLWAVGCILLLGLLNLFGPRRSGNAALAVAIAAIVTTVVIAGAALPMCSTPKSVLPQEDPWNGGSVSPSSFWPFQVWRPLPI